MGLILIEFTVLIKPGARGLFSLFAPLLFDGTSSKMSSCIYLQVNQCKYASNPGESPLEISSHCIATSRERSKVCDDSLFKKLSDQGVSEFLGHKRCVKDYNCATKTARFVESKKKKRKSQKNLHTTPNKVARLR